MVEDGCDTNATSSPPDWRRTYPRSWRRQGAWWAPRSSKPVWGRELPGGFDSRPPPLRRHQRKRGERREQCKNPSVDRWRLRAGLAELVGDGWRVESSVRPLGCRASGRLEVRDDPTASRRLAPRDRDCMRPGRRLVVVLLRGVALARSIFGKGANLTAAMAVEFASTNLVIELRFILALLMGWQSRVATYGVSLRRGTQDRGSGQRDAAPEPAIDESQSEAGSAIAGRGGNHGRADR
jgi:Predicted permease